MFNFQSKMAHFVGMCVFLTVIQSVVSLECYSCNVSTSTSDEDGCYGIGTVKKCPGSSVCLSATYEVNSGIVKTYAIVQSCFIDMAGQECDSFFKSQKDLHRGVAITPGTCYSCANDNCNKKQNKPSAGNVARLRLTDMVMSLLGILVIKLFVF